MAHFFLLLFVSLAIETFGATPDLSRIDQLLDNRYNPRNQRELNFDPKNYPQDMRKNEVDSDYESKMKNRRHDDDDYLQMRANRPIPYGKTSQETTDGKKLVPIPHPIPVLVPLIMSQPYPVPMFPVNLSTMHKNHPHERMHNHQLVFSDHDHEHSYDAHSHEHQSDLHDHEHQYQSDGHAHEHQYQSDGHAHEHEFDEHAH